MNRNKLFLVIALLAAVVVAAGGYFLGVQPQMATASANDAQRATIEATNTANADELARLQAKFVAIDAAKAKLSGLEASVPSTADTAAFIDELNTIASSTGITLSSIDFSSAQAYTAPAGTIAPTDTSSTATGSASASPSATPSASASASPDTSSTDTSSTGSTSTGAPATNAAITGSNFTVIPVNLTIKAPGATQALAFIHGVQNGSRLYLINTLASSSQAASTAADGTTTAGGLTSWTVSGYIYVLKPSTTSTTTATGTSSTSTQAQG